MKLIFCYITLIVHKSIKRTVGISVCLVSIGYTLSAWRHEFSPTIKTLNSLWVTRGGVPWVVGESGLILRYERF